MSRSQLFSDAVEEFRDQRENDDLTASLNAVYDKEDSSIYPVLLKMTLLSVPGEEW